MIYHFIIIILFYLTRSIFLCLSIILNIVQSHFQSLNDKHLKFLSRIHTAKDCIKTFEHARKAGFDNINTDMIFNIPGLTLKEWMLECLDSVLWLFWI